MKFEEGRYQVRFPWKSHECIPKDNRKLAEGRLMSLIKRLKNDEEQLNLYQKTIDDQVEKRVIEKVTNKTIISGRIHYLPHHPVVKRENEKIKLRIVYDASARIKQGEFSLNDCLYRGQVILENLVALLLRFRLEAIAMTSDIEKAFLQVGLQVEDRDVTRFLWVKDKSKAVEDGNIEIYRFTRVPFGIVASPFLLGATIKYHLLNSNEDGKRALIVSSQIPYFF